MINTLTIYTNDFDKYENIVNNGMSGKVFIDIDNNLGLEFNSIDEALNYSTDNGLQIHKIEFNYLSKDKDHMFQKFNIEH